jgi:hypothetical protein
VEPDFDMLKVGGPLLVKHTDGVWHEAVLLDVLEPKAGTVKQRNPSTSTSTSTNTSASTSTSTSSYHQRMNFAALDAEKDDDAGRRFKIRFVEYNSARVVGGHEIYPLAAREEEPPDESSDDDCPQLESREGGEKNTQGNGSTHAMSTTTGGGGAAAAFTPPSSTSLLVRGLVAAGQAPEDRDFKPFIFGDIPQAGHGARFSAEIYTRGCHWIPRMFA